MQVFAQVRTYPSISSQLLVVTLCSLNFIWVDSCSESAVTSKFLIILVIPDFSSYRKSYSSYVLYLSTKCCLKKHYLKLLFV